MRKITLSVFVCLFLFALYSTSSIYAHDNEKYEYELKKGHADRYEDEEDYEDYDEDRDEYNHGYRSEGVNREEQAIARREYWYKWSRSADIPNEYEETPISSKQIVPIRLMSKAPLYIMVIPKQGQIFVPLEDTARYLGASVTIYPYSQIGEIQLGDHYLIVRNGTRVVYENMKKTPMPLPIFMEQGKLYIPISVLANGLGFQVAWTGEQIQID
ncbi:copper amine oxidase N-terminal domain-containing protein [Geobacillus jurassicus]|uniref:Copper amine oxidase N-terminal domain-containing protein n=1 Tax=Geobacillus jurassicus TaxID=235932 RepID=A0ABV6GT51_9BACL|nr:copper amine oxidase N-terminal domain-containing protein [Geobacillus jurassicus]